MKIDLVNIGIRLIDQKAKEIAQDAANYMKTQAPEPRNVSIGPGSESTGALKRSIRYWDISFGNGNPVYYVGPAGNTAGNDGLPIKEYAPFADQGRGEIFVPPQGTAKAMAFTPKHGNPMVVHHVAEMQGWNYIDNTLKYIRQKYGGQ